MPSISEVDPAVTHAVKNLQSLSQERWEIYSWRFWAVDTYLILTRVAASFIMNGLSKRIKKFELGILQAKTFNFCVVKKQFFSVLHVTS
jgi:hypothetical protein